MPQPSSGRSEQSWPEPPQHPSGFIAHLGGRTLQNASQPATGFWLDRLFGPTPTRELLARLKFARLESDLPSDSLQCNTSLTNPDLAFPPSPSSLPALVHDVSNMVSAIDLYCDLLEEPGVISEPFRHYSSGLRQVGLSSRRLMDKLADLVAAAASEPSEFRPSPTNRANHHNLTPALTAPAIPTRHSTLAPSLPPTLPAGKLIASLADELHANLNLLSALVGPGITVGLAITGGTQPVAMEPEAFTRILVNLASNAADAMPGGGHIQIDLEEHSGHMCLSVADTGPGIPESALEAIFSPGYSTHVSLDPANRSNAWPVQHRGLGLFLVRSIVSAAGGVVWAANRNRDLTSQINPTLAATGAILWIEFPIPESLTDSATGDFNSPPGIT